MKSESVKLDCLAFEELDIYILYQIMRLRQEIFVVEQDCPYLDADGVDLKSHHVTLHLDNKLVGYTRIVPPEISYKGHSSIGRVVTHPNYRIHGLGTKLMIYSIAKTKELYPALSIKISSQVYITKFYAQLGFEPTGDEYLEDDIPHIAMIYA